MVMQDNISFDMFSFFEMTPDLVFIASKEGYFKKLNRAAINKLGYSLEELLSKPISSFIHPDDRETTARLRTELIGGKALVNFQNRYIKKDSEIIWLEWSSIYSPEREIVFAIAKDITERKRAEQQVEEKYKKYRSLASHFKTSIERERKHLSIELHEELAQLASVVKMDLDWISNHTQQNEMVKERLEHATGVSELLINAIRRISYAISPAMLEDIGFNETLKWLCKEFSILNGIPCAFESNCLDDELSHEMQLDFYRICQEALSNIMYHARANSASICIHSTEERIYLVIQDDGKGFDPEEYSQSSGIISMRERSASINGTLTVSSKAGKGTEVCVEVEKKLSEFI